METIFFKNTKVAFTDSGKGNAVVLLHGFLENQLMWSAFIEHLAVKFRVITIDLLGHGATQSRGYIHLMEDNADVVHAVLSHLRIKKAAIAGHSMGGYVALAFAEIYPEMIRSIALINSTSRADSEERKINRDRAILAVKHDYTTFVRLAIANLFSPANRERLADEIEYVKREALKTPLQGIVASLQGMKQRKDREVILHFGSFPKLLVLGENDSVLSYDENVDQVENTDVKLVSFPDGHMSIIENFDALLKELLAFFKTK